MKQRITNKKRIKSLLEADNWQENLASIAEEGLPAVGALFSFLPQGSALMHRGARALGLLLAKVFEKNPEEARNIVRSFMWHMNEESGNIGWGIPVAFAETLVASPGLAQTYSRILDSYIMDLGFDDNYCDHDILRRDCYWAIGRLAEAHPDLAEPARKWLIGGLEDRDEICRGMAAWALGKLKPDLMAMPGLRKLEETGKADICEIFEGDGYISRSASSLAAETLRKISGRGEMETESE